MHHCRCSLGEKGEDRPEKGEDRPEKGEDRPLSGLKSRSTKDLEQQKCICYPYCNWRSWDSE